VPVVATPTETVESEEVVPPGEEPEAIVAVSSVATPLLALGRSRYAVAGLGALSLLSLLGALEISKRPRRASGPNLTQDSVGGGST
jgi:hypothetical protein